MNNNIIEKEISHADFETSGPTHIKKVYSSSKEKKNQTANERENFDRLSKMLNETKSIMYSVLTNIEDYNSNV
uniref:Uncharacterized protein n=1 Tax=Timema poppense TaxID=170557 RepID=A0A7R9CVR3_TIMPO|nr:unnamed protein product [Timema poppensis]